MLWAYFVWNMEKKQKKNHTNKRLFLASISLSYETYWVRMTLNDFGDPLTFPLVYSWPKFSLISWNISISTKWIGIKSDTDIYDPQRMNIKDFGDPLTFHLATSANVLVYDHIPAKIMIFPSASIVLCVLMLRRLTCWHQHLAQNSAIPTASKVR